MAKTNTVTLIALTILITTKVRANTLELEFTADADKIHEVLLISEACNKVFAQMNPDKIQNEEIITMDVNRDKDKILNLYLKVPELEDITFDGCAHAQETVEAILTISHKIKESGNNEVPEDFEAAHKKIIQMLQNNVPILQITIQGSIINKEESSEANKIDDVTADCIVRLCNHDYSIDTPSSEYKDFLNVQRRF